MEKPPIPTLELKKRGTGRPKRPKDHGIRSRICQIEGCSLPHSARNLCIKHYKETFPEKNRWRITPRMVLAREVAEITGLTIPEATKIIRIITKTITSALRRGEQVYIRGFGTFEVNPRAPNSLWGPRFSFRPAKSLHYMLNQDYKGPLTP